MRTTVSSKGGLVAAACLLALLPTGAANAGDAPPPAGHRELAKTEAMPEGNPSSHAAQAAGVCNDAYQIGKTGHIERKGEIIASVKQFYSKNCHRNYGYLWVWESFRAKHRSYSANIAVHDFRTNELVGLRSWSGTHQQEFWSYPADTVRDCTAARGVVRAPGDQNQNFAYSSKVC
ncbi:MULTISPECIES: hypothetical protein [unclassified Streptomyces]|uniref:hypothetical protein n=1 Tax=unclassified Streptomyces TaxID=2593676 RepID=UPI002DDC4879|nr:MULTISPECIES: hypothetical protein [unclassified Streptomyces]WSA94903.1 hypothetical protein OIE63_27560 [Streptomyces sp. NBC_01795]WSB79323.1 hypothetical protein OHB04_28680 [Streptomyces sp. NBC_01775]WSS12471.1 hypothetical protein OG533_11530 [Streptomyces sp. NBC_01186]WSS41258.1 hypothetical protein OG220_12080 [Streptomyces sp. NBC_01187]